MKYHFPLYAYTLLWFVFFQAIQCTGQKNKGLNGDQENNTKEVPLKEIEGMAFPEGLENEIPITKDILKSWLPEHIGVYARSKLVSGHKESVEMSGIQAVYHNPSETEKIITIEILDGAGVSGSVMLQAAQQKLKLDYEEKKQNSYTRIYEREGVRTREMENDFEEYSEIEFIDQNRYHFVFKAQKININELWEFIQISGLEA
jgi:hypothetical protein